MVFAVLLVLAHGADPRPITWDEASANMVKFFVTILLAVVMVYPIIAPLFPSKKGEGDQPAEASESNSGLIGWVGVGVLVMLSMGWWLTRASLVELSVKETPMMVDHRHTQERGGQVAMWGDFHAEVARIESGEVRIYLTDSYNRPIAARFFTAEIAAIDLEQTPSGPATPRVDATATPIPASIPKQTEMAPASQAHPTVPALDDSYRFARLDRAAKHYRIRVTTPGWAVTLKFDFDGDNGRRSLPIWCGTP